jgi:hypothetical protein
MLLLSMTLKAQTFTSEQAVYYALNQDSLIKEYARYIFMVKNSKGESLESFGKKKMGKDYDKFLVPMFDTARRKDMSIFKLFVMSFRFKKLVEQVKKEFVEDKIYRNKLDRTWYHAHLIINEFICTKKDYNSFLESVLEKDKLYFTAFMLPVVMNMDILFSK